MKRPGFDIFNAFVVMWAVWLFGMTAEQTEKLIREGPSQQNLSALLELAFVYLYFVFMYTHVVGIYWPEAVRGGPQGQF
ncbi:MAG: hypothetical protein ACP5I3_09055 [Thermoproteus sp.]